MAARSAFIRKPSSFDGALSQGSGRASASRKLSSRQPIAAMAGAAADKAKQEAKELQLKRELNAAFEDLGKAKKIVIDKDNTTIVDAPERRATSRLA